jgi:galactokinase
MDLRGWLSELKEDHNLLEQRYGDEAPLRSPSYAILLEAATKEFEMDQPVAVVASPGRDRIFMGHSDFAGLGGFTVDAATQSELLAIGQLESGGKIRLMNTDPAYESCEFEGEEILKVAQDQEAYGKCIWPPAQWSSYIKGALCFLVSSRFEGHKKLRQALGWEEPAMGKRDREGSSPRAARIGLKFLVSSQGPLGLLALGGSSSSAALTGAFTLGLMDLLGLEFTKDQLAQSDYGEYYLGKLAGAADKMAQLNAERGQVVVVGSRPERCIRTLHFPKAVVVMLADCPTPRLTTKKGDEWLATHYPETKEHVRSWAQATMKRFSSAALALAADLLTVGLRSIDKDVPGEVSREESELLLGCLFAGEETRSYKGPLLRELCRGGALEARMSGTMKERHNLVFRALKLIPEQQLAEGYLYTPRKVALYGLSEVERGAAYLDQLQVIGSVGSQEARERLLQFVRWSHDGDRACVDYRHRADTIGSGIFVNTIWNERLHCDLDNWLENGADLVECVGGFERSLPEMDEMADELDREFGKQAAARVSAAGLGGQMCIHAFEEVAHKVAAYLTGRGWSVRTLQPGSPTQVLKRRNV